MENVEKNVETTIVRNLQRIVDDRAEWVYVIEKAKRHSGLLGYGRGNFAYFIGF